MQIRRKSNLALLAIVFSLVISTISAAQQKESQATGEIRIKNFGQMDERFYRGAQPKENDYAALAALGIRTIIDLRDDPRAYEKPAAEAAGMHYVNIPMDDKSYPKPENVDAFLKLVNDPATGKFFVHCAGGRHRTGVMGAVYRFTNYNWNFEQVYAEMKRYDFYSSWGHGPMKKYVEDLWSNIQSGKTAVVAAEK
jgi:protein tyrosine/serine phosphatase